MSLTVRQSRMLGTSDGQEATVSYFDSPRKVWTSQPQFPVKAYSSAFSAWLPSATSSNCVNFTNPFSAVNVGSAPGAAKFDSSNYLTFADYHKFIDNIDGNIEGYGGFLSVTFIATILSTDNGFIFQAGGNRFNVGIGVEGITGNQLGVSYYDGSDFRKVSTANFSIGKPVVIQASLYSDHVDLYINSEYVGQATGSEPRLTYNRSSDIGRQTWGGGTTSANFLLHGAVFTRNSSPAFLRQLRENPWQIFAPQPSRTWVPV